MIIQIKANGTVEKAVFPRIFQGTHNYYVLHLLAPFTDSFTATFNVRLPDGSSYGDMMTFNKMIDGLGQWTYPLNSTMTSIDGRIELSFNISLNDKVLTTAITHYTVEDSILMGDDFEEHMASFNRLLELINDKVSYDELQQILENLDIPEGVGMEEVWIGSEPPPPDKKDIKMWVKITHEEVKI